MIRTTMACLAAAAAITLTVTATISHASARDRSVTIAVGDTAVFPGTDLICDNEPGCGAPRFHAPGVACSSFGDPYQGLGIWITDTHLILTTPPNGKAIYGHKR